MVMTKTRANGYQLVPYTSQTNISPYRRQP